MGWRFGIATADVTPATPQWMAGMGYRTEKSKGVYLPLVASAFYMSDGVNEALVYSMDILDFPGDLVRRLRANICRTTHVRGDHVVFCATHSHDTPRITDRIVLPGEVDPDYVSEVEAKLLALADAAKRSARAGRIEFSRVRAKVGVNRRQYDPEQGVAKHAPNPEGAHDRAVDSRWVLDRRGRVVTSLTTYGCHATACGGYELGGDFPGFFRLAVARATAAPAVWLAGCGANVRAWFTGAMDSYGGGTVAAARKMGVAHANNVLSGRKRTRPVELSVLRVSRKVIRLPLQKAWPYRKFRKVFFEWYVERFGEERVREAYESARKKKSAGFEIQLMSLNQDHHMVFWSGEVVTEIGMALKDLCPGQIVTTQANANESTSYIPARHMFPLGGYEVVRSCGLYRLPAPYQPGVEDRILRATLGMIDAHRV